MLLIKQVCMYVLQYLNVELVQELLIITRAAAGLLLLQCATAICYSIAPPLGHLISAENFVIVLLAIAHNGIQH